MGMRFPIDVAYLDDEGNVIKTMQMHRNRVGVPVWRGDQVIEAEAGAFARWGLRVGDVIDVREDDLHADGEHGDHTGNGMAGGDDAGNGSE
jgi:uncharacterized membrane protein (UPF0127 family)